MLEFVKLDEGTGPWHKCISDRVIIKSRLSSSKNILFICLIESPLEVMKNAFYFILKALFVLKIFKFLSRLFGHVGKKA